MKLNLLEDLVDDQDKERLALAASANSANSAPSPAPFLHLWALKELEPIDEEEEASKEAEGVNEEEEYKIRDNDGAMTSAPNDESDQS